MMKILTINFIVPSLNRKYFGGGQYCIIKYADELAKKGHNINIIPLYKSERPKWINCKANYIFKNQKSIFDNSIKNTFKNITSIIDKKLFRLKTDFVKRAINLDYMKDVIKNADVTVATRWDTAEIVYRFGKGRKVYFIQHFEPLFFDDNDSYNKKLCEWSYQLPLVKIANSSWLQNKLYDYSNSHSINEKIYKCINAVDLDIYKKQNIIKDRKHNKHIKIISYGGRKVKWKGFEEMAKAIYAVRNELKNYEIEWEVFGDAILPSNNEFAPYKSLGFLNPYELNKVYNQCDILLSASWYESFPLFPAEAMACGLATITTKSGTEDYAIHGETAEVVEEKNPDSIANGLIKLIVNKDYRENIANSGNKYIQKFNWSNSTKNMENILNNIL